MMVDGSSVVLPFPSTSLVEEPFLTFDGASLLRRLVFFADGDQRVWEIVFERAGEPPPVSRAG